MSAHTATATLLEPYCVLLPRWKGPTLHRRTNGAQRVRVTGLGRELSSSVGSCLAPIPKPPHYVPVFPNVGSGSLQGS